MPKLLPMPKSYALRVLWGGALLLAALSAIWLAINFIGTGISPGEPAVSRATEITGIENPLDDNGDIDYLLLANIKQMVGVKRDNNAVVPFVETCQLAVPEHYTDRFFYLLSMERPDPESASFVTAETWIDENVVSRQSQKADNSPASPTAQQFAEFGSQHLWTDDELPELARWLEAIEEPLTTLAEAAKREHFYIPFVVSDSYRTSFPELQYTLSRVQETARAFKTRANFCLANGDFQGWMEDIDTIYRLGRLVERGNSITNQLVAIGLNRMADEGVTSAAANGKLNSEQLQSVMAKLQEMPSVNGMSRSIRDGERLFALDWMTACARWGIAALDSDGARQGFYQSLLMKTADWNQVIETINSDFLRLAEIVRATDAEMLNAAETYESEMDQRRRDLRHPATTIKAVLSGRLAKGHLVGRQFSAMLIPGPTSICNSILRHRTQRHLTILALALQQFHQENGSYPASLDELVPDFMQKLEPHVLAHGPIAYRPAGQQYELYSRSASENNAVDSEGRELNDDRDFQLELTRYQDWHDFLSSAAAD